MKLIVDTSALLAVVLNEPERSAAIDAAQGCSLLAPSVLPFEIGNALSALSKRRLLKANQVVSAWQAFLLVPVSLCTVDMVAALGLATRNAIYAYDAYVIQCALEQRAELLTLDKRMRIAASSEGVVLRGVPRA